MNSFAHSGQDSFIHWPISNAYEGYTYKECMIRKINGMTKAYVDLITTQKDYTFVACVCYCGVYILIKQNLT